MAILLYNIFLWLFRIGASIKALFNAKAQKWVAGRKQLFQKLENAIADNEKIIWFHCASLGEFEQGRPVMEALKKQYNNYKLLLTFFSPSGYEAQQNYLQADWVFYLPMDRSTNAKQWLKIVQPKLVIFVKYEFWYYYLREIKKQNIPFLLISARFSKDSIFFKWYGNFYRKMLYCYSHIFVQTKESGENLASIDSAIPYSIAGDTRYDRVEQIASSVQTNSLIDNFLNGQKAIICGSTWPEDEKMLAAVCANLKNENLRFIIAPHEINKTHLNNLSSLFPNSIFYSAHEKNKTADNASVLIIDNVGMLSTVYQYAFASYVGGGLKPNGVHNVLEAAVFYKPVLLGPYFEKYNEAVALVKRGGGVVVKNAPAFEKKLKEWLTNQADYTKAANAAGQLVQSRIGATQKIVNYIQEKRLLTN
ncbi:MAG TPA: glycosyltransferase N-terminal domain-containing protein [Chitinophagaceae bacterium]|nr:glycosyltransferase N-terminal domain-containing protein [Chitinophagaceae bacterium]